MSQVYFKVQNKTWLNLRRYQQLHNNGWYLGFEYTALDECVNLTHRHSSLFAGAAAASVTFTCPLTKAVSTPSLCRSLATKMYFNSLISRSWNCNGKTALQVTPQHYGLRLERCTSGAEE